MRGHPARCPPPRRQSGQRRAAQTSPHTLRGPGGCGPFDPGRERAAPVQVPSPAEVAGRSPSPVRPRISQQQLQDQQGGLLRRAQPVKAAVADYGMVRISSP